MSPSASRRHNRLVRMPRELLSVEFGDLAGLGIPEDGIARFRAYLANLEPLPRPEDSRALVGPAEITTPALMVLARRVGQAFRDHNIQLRESTSRLQQDRLKLAYLPAGELSGLSHEEWAELWSVAALFISDGQADQARFLERVARTRLRHGLPTFVGCEVRLRGLESIELRAASGGHDRV